MFRTRTIQKHVNDIRKYPLTAAGSADELVKLNATEAVPDLLEILEKNAGVERLVSGIPEACIQALSEIGCPDQGDDLLAAMIAEADYQRNKEDDGIPKFGLRLGESRWKNRLEFLWLAHSGGIKEFDQLMKMLFVMGGHIDGYLVTCLRILSWRLRLIDQVVCLPVDFNSIYRQASPVLFDSPIANAYNGMRKHSCPMSSNLLHLVEEKKDVDIHFYASAVRVATKTIEYGRWRRMAAEELRNRGDPVYMVENYQVACECNVRYKQTSIPENVSAWWIWGGR